MMVPYAINPLPWDRYVRITKRYWKLLTYHDIMSKALPQIVAPAVTPEDDRAEQHLHPGKNRIRLAYYAMEAYCPWPESLFVYV